jgi:hypothetical protein
VGERESSRVAVDQVGSCLLRLVDDVRFDVSDQAGNRWFDVALRELVNHHRQIGRGEVHADVLLGVDGQGLRCFRGVLNYEGCARRNRVFVTVTEVNGVTLLGSGSGELRIILTFALG